MNIKRLKEVLVLLILLLSCSSSLFAQIKGVVLDAKTNEPLSYIAVFYENKGVGVITDTNGNFAVETRSTWNELVFSAMGYETKKVKFTPGKTRFLKVLLSESDTQLAEVVVTPKKEHYRRKDNPAVILMRKVIANKKHDALKENPYYQYDKYQKITMSLNDITPEKMTTGIFKKLPFLKDQVEVSPITKKMILPISVQETASQYFYRKDPKSEKTIINGVQSDGIGDFFSTGDILTTVLKDVFSDIDIYDNNIRLLQTRFVSPISSTSAISFYKFYIMDTLQVDKRSCIHLSFVPQNSQDFGFTGHLYVLNDSSYQVVKCTMNLPKKTGINFVENLDILQEYTQLDNGEWVLKTDDMLAELHLSKGMQGMQVRRVTRYTDYLFQELPQQLFKGKAKTVRQPSAMMRDDSFWNQKRDVPLTNKENTVSLLMKKLENTPGFKTIIFVARAFIENFVETAAHDKPNKVDIGPINTMIGNNFVDGFRLRASALTTANFNPHWFFSGYVAYGFKDKRMKYQGKVEYSIDKKEYLAREFPKNNITASYQYDVFSPTDKFLKTDKDNVFVGFKTTTVDQMSYLRNFSLAYERETQVGFSTLLRFRNTIDEPTGQLQYIRNTSAGQMVQSMNTTDAMFEVRYAPGETFINTKQRRIPVTFDAPVFTASHTLGVKAFGGNYAFNLTQASIYKRFWLSSWGNLDFTIKGGIQWDKVPFPLLIMPEANLSYITQRGTFSLINNLEFLNDRFASLDIAYTMNGKLFNRIPLLKKLKLREFFGFKMLYGSLTDKNNPFVHDNDSELFRFPTRNGQQTSYVMDPNDPYMEVTFGIHNIFKLLHVDYVRRLSYLNHPGINKDGLRFMILLQF
ncbi:MAG: DUF5686 family protein [Bacteroidaceae bacterium]